MASFESIFPTFLQKCAELHELLRVVAFMLFIVGTILFVQHGFSGKTLILHMLSVNRRQVLWFVRPLIKGRQLSGMRMRITI